MIRSIGFRCKRGDTLSREVLIGRISCKEYCTSRKASKMSEFAFVSVGPLGTVFRYGFLAALPQQTQLHPICESFANTILSEVSCLNEDM